MIKYIKGVALITRRSICEAFGSDRYSRPALNDLDRRLEKYLDFDGGFFIEAGANDGFNQSNTYYFEKLRRWRGLLIEPIPVLYRRCRLLRHRSNVFHAALVGPDFLAKTIAINYADLMSVVDGSLGSESAVRRHLEDAAPSVRKLGVPERLMVPARTLSSIIDEAKVNRPIDLLSLDVEGYEPNALRGLDFSRHRPRFLLIEVRDIAAVEAVILPFYRKVEVLADLGTHCDILYEVMSPDISAAVER